MSDHPLPPHHPQRPSPSSTLQLQTMPTSDIPKRPRQRTLRACDACRKMKIKCMMNSDQAPCEACKLASRACKFEHVGVKREKPPSVGEVEQLKRKITQLETILVRLRPQIDLNLLPRTNDQAKSIANALQGTPPSSSNHQVNDRIHASRHIPVKQVDHHNPECVELQHDSQDEHEGGRERREVEEEEPEEEEDDDDDEDDDEEEEEEYQTMLQAMGECQLKSYQLFEQAKDPTGHHDNQQPRSLEAFPTILEPESQQIPLSEQYVEKFFRVTPSTSWPDPDLAETLISTYFESVHPYPRLVHEPEFKNDYQAGLADRDKSFKRLCYAIFAAASPYCDDPRVLHPTLSDGPHPRQSAGALFAHASLHETPPQSDLSLFQLQSFAVLSCYMLAMSNPRHTFALVVDFIRRSVTSEVHLEDSPRWNSSFIKNQLRKRAFFSLIAVERQTTCSLGYLRVPQPLPNIVSPPLCCDDETLSLFDKQDKMQPTPEARKHFRRQLHLRAQTPAEAAFNSLWAFRNKLESKNRNMILNQLKPHSSTSTSSTADGDPSAKVNNSRHQFMLNFEAVVADFLDNEMNPLGRWNPSLTSKDDLFATSHSSCLLWSFQIRVHLEGVSFYQELVNPCFQAASSIVDTLEDLKVLGHLHILQGTVPYFLAPVGLFFLWAISQENHPIVTAHFKANAWLKINRCVQILNTLAPVSFVSEKLSSKFTAYMKDLQEESRTPPMGNGASTTKSQKRQLSEIMAKKVEQPTISNLLFSQHSSPTNQNSHIDPGRSDSSYPNLNLSEPMPTIQTSQLPNRDYSTNIPVAATGIPHPINRPYACNPVTYPPLQLQNLLLQSVNVPKSPLDADYSNLPLPVGKLQTNYPPHLEGAANPTSLPARLDASYLRSAFPSSTTPVISEPRTHPVIIQDRQTYPRMNESSSPISGGTSRQPLSLRTIGVFKIRTTTIHLKHI
ncbi:hypothetical protein VP01_70g3 [Puccinia sorghi]|uniref:Zn(2)-C6 fungal-type domain-containing protein n=1 Tax=Puccinia sorghi TaxID=27349 RepID=A0A0L6UFQ5_9BASI|nr:hypothetical protein VP01_70g3 [Puccinia sorghi]